MATITYTVTVASGTNQYGTGNKFYINGEVSPVLYFCLLYTSPSPRDLSTSRMPSSA